MTDSTENSSATQRPRYLADEFDLDPKYLHVAFAKTSESTEFDPAFDNSASSSSHSIVDLPKSGIVFLLGKNGAGKSRFLHGLEAFTRAKEEEFPSISLICEIPDIESYVEYKEELRGMIKPKFRNKVEDVGFHLKYGDLHLSDALLSSFQSCPLPVLPQSGYGSSGHEILRAFGCAEEDLVQWQKRRDLFTDPSDAFHEGNYEDQRLRESFMLSDHVPEFVLSALAASFLDLAQRPFDRHSFRGTREEYNYGVEWWTDVEKRHTTFLLLKELIQTATHIEIYPKNDRMVFSLLVREPTQGCLYDFLNDRNLQDRTKTIYRVDEDGSICDPEIETMDNFTDSYPFDLVSEVELFGETYIKSISIPFGADSQYKSWYLTDLMVFDLAGSRQEKVRELQEQIYHHCELRRIKGILRNQEEYIGTVKYHRAEPFTKMIDGDEQTVSVTGYNKIHNVLLAVSEQVRDCELGINELRATSPVPKWSDLATTFDFAPIIEFQNSETLEWLPLAQASQGQFDVMHLFIQLKLVALRNSTLRLLLADEFDKNLHPTSAVRVLELVQRYATNNKIVVFISTHSLPNYASSPMIRTQPRIFFDRDVEGGIQITQESSSDPKIVAEMLGTSEFDAYRLKRLFVMVEGLHEVAIFDDLFKSQIEILQEIYMFTTYGTDGYQGAWEGVIRILDIPLLIIYDKKNNALETAWAEIRAAVADPQNTSNLWRDFGIKTIFSELNDRKKKNIFVEGDKELHSLVWLLKGVLESDDSRRNVERIELHGVDYPDIVDALPIWHFRSSYKSWNEARSSNSNIKSTDFKRTMNIRVDTIKGSLAKIKVHSDPELLKIREKVISLLARKTF